MLQRAMHHINTFTRDSQIASADQLMKNKPFPNGKMSDAEVDECDKTYSTVLVTQCKSLPCS